MNDVADICPFIDHMDFNYSMSISLNNKYLYVETPKVACSSIKATLQKIEYKDTFSTHKEFINWHDRDASPLLKPSQIFNIKKFIDRDDIYKFCFVRSPYSRLLSAYLNKIYKDKPQKRMILLQLGRNPNDLSHFISFEEFVDAVIEEPISMMDRHWRTQYYQTFQKGIDYDFIGKFESFDKDLFSVLGTISHNYKPYLTNVLGHITGADDKLEKFYTKSLKKKVYEKYAIDFEYFGYFE